MALNIKNERVHALARMAAERTGKSQTAVIEEALERLLAELAQEEARATRAAQAWEWFENLKNEVTDADRAAVWAAMDDMYDDETGLPR